MRNLKFKKNKAVKVILEKMRNLKFKKNKAVEVILE
jgi:hypothetical protein